MERKLTENAMSIFKKLYAINSEQLTPEQREAHARDLAGASMLIESLQNAELRKLTSTQSAVIKELAPKLAQLNSELIELKDTETILTRMTYGLQLLKGLSKVLA